MFGKRVSVAVFTAGVLLGACSANHPRTSNSAINTVDIPLTSIDNQQKAGFCWSYTVHALAEALAKKKGVTVNLSEEFVALHHMVRQLKAMVASENPLESLQSLTEGNVYDVALQTFNEIGMVPEEYFKVKFDKPPAAIAKAYFSAEFKDPQKLEDFKENPDKLREALGKAFNIDIPKVDSEFTYEGKSYTSKSFMLEKVRFDPSDFTVREFDYNKIGNFEVESEILKAALLQKIPVPLAVGVFPGNDTVWDSEACEKGFCDLSGGHGMLAVDFVTKKGRAGEMTAEEIKNVYHNKLEKLVVKNSWGLRGLTQQGETSKNEAVLGFDVLTKDFLKFSMLIRHTNYLVPKSLVDGSKYFAGFSLKTVIGMNRSILENQNFALNATIVDSTLKSTARATFEWSILDANGQEVFSDKGIEAQVPGLAQGEYKVILTTKQDEQKSVTKKPLAILKNYDIFKDNIQIKTSNRLVWDTSLEESQLTLNYAATSSIEKLAPMIVELPLLKMQKGQAAEVSFNYNPHLAPTSKIIFEASMDGDKFKSIPCNFNYKKPLFYVTCAVPSFETMEENKDVKIRFYANISKINADEIKHGIVISSLAIKSSSPLAVATPSVRPLAFLPEGTSDVKYQHVNQKQKYVGLFSKSAHQVRVYIDGKLENEFAASDLKAFGNSLLQAETELSFPNTGAHEVDLVAVAEGVEVSFIRYKVLVAPTVVADGTPKLLIGGQNLEVAYDPTFTAFKSQNGALRLSFTEFSSQGSPFPIPNNLTARIATWLDFSDNQNPLLGLAGVMSLEEKADYFRILVSEDAGKTFATLQEYTGVFQDKTILPLESLAGKKDVLLVLELDTDASVNSEIGALLQLVVK